MRFKFDRNDPDSYRCCVCCHVRTGTILLGIFHLFIHLLVFSLFAILCLHPQLLLSQDALQKPAEVASLNVAPSNQTQVEPYHGYAHWFRHRSYKTWTSEDKFVALLVTVGSFMMALMLVYGAIKGRPGYLMPFFCLQVFDFCVSCLTAVGYFSYFPDIKQWIDLQGNLPFQDQLLKMDRDWLMLMAILFFVFVLSLKAYFIGVVWACYKYLTQYQQGLARGAVIRAYGGDTNTEDAEMLLPPKYEDAINMPVDDRPPPPAYAQTDA